MQKVKKLSVSIKNIIKKHIRRKHNQSLKKYYLNYKIYKKYILKFSL